MEDHPRALGWTPGPEDDRDFLLSTFAPERPTLSGEEGWGWAGMNDLNQLSEGACTSFSIGNAVNCEPRRSDIDSDFCFDAYHATTERDEFPGDWNTGQEGTSLRSAMQEWRRRRKISSFAFSYSVEEVVNWVLTRGPMCIGVRWYEGMDDPHGGERLVSGAHGRDPGWARHLRTPRPLGHGRREFCGTP